MTESRWNPIIHPRVKIYGVRLCNNWLGSSRFRWRGLLLTASFWILSALSFFLHIGLFEKAQCCCYNFAVLLFQCFFEDLLQFYIQRQCYNNFIFKNIQGITKRILTHKSEYFRWWRFPSNILPTSSLSVLFHLAVTFLEYIQQQRKVLVRTKLIWMGLKDNNHQFFEYLLSFTFPQHMVCVQSPCPS